MEYTGNVRRKTSHSLHESSSDVSSDSLSIPSPVVIKTTKKRKNDNVNKILKYDDDNSDNTFITDKEDDSNDDTNDDGIVTEINDVINDRNDVWTKLRVITESQSNTIILPLRLPKNKLSPPSKRDRVRLSRQKQTLLQKEVARKKNNKWSRDFYNNLSLIQKKRQYERTKSYQAKQKALNPTYCPKTKHDPMITKKTKMCKSSSNGRVPYFLLQPKKITIQSFYNKEIDIPATSLAVRWCQTDFLDMYKDLIVRIAPLSNAAKFSHQTGQPFRIFYSRKNCTTCWDDNVNERALYGVAGIMSTTCYDMNKFRVLPFSTLIKELANLIQDKHKIVVSSLEIKVYQGNDVFTENSTGRPITNNSGKYIRADCNNRTGLHNDHLFDLEGVQSAKDTSVSDQNVVTLSIGSTCQLTFFNLVSNRNNKWTVIGKNKVYDLKHGCTFNLVPDDKIPECVNGLYYKTQHSARLIEQDMPFAFVFHRVDKNGYFDNITNTWNWRMENSLATKLHVSKHIKKFTNACARTNAAKGDCGLLKEIEEMKNNVSKFVTPLNENQLSYKL